MEGYSVTEAASVLGVPTERVWELLARGVLSGVPDGETGMRVFLQPRPAPIAVDESRRTAPSFGGIPENIGQVSSIHDASARRRSGEARGVKYRIRAPTP